MWLKKEEKSPDIFWQEYEERTGEKILGRGLGKYVSGWDEFDEKKLKGIWGLVITTSGGFRFHHFFQKTWMDSLFSSSSQAALPKDKTIFIPQEKIISTEFIEEKKWWKKIFTSSAPQLVIVYKDEQSGEEKRLVFEAEYNAK
jgi:hypothetical protein